MHGVSIQPTQSESHFGKILSIVVQIFAQYFPRLALPRLQKQGNGLAILGYE
jgi:hypothetical protein